MLLQNNVNLVERDFFKQPFKEVELRDLLNTKPSSELFAWRSPSFKALGISPDILSDDDLVHLMLKEPRLIRRPIILVNDTLVVGSDRKSINELFNLT